MRSRVLGGLATVVVAVALSGCAAVPPADGGPAGGHIRSHAGIAPTDPGAGAAAPTPGPAPSASATASPMVIRERATSSVLLLPAHPRGALAVFVHGSGQSSRSILRDRHDRAIADELVRHGYLVLAADAGGRAWGDPASVADYERLIASTERTYDVHEVDLMAESMGGLATMQLAARVPDVRAVTAWYPVCDLRTMARKPRFAAAIDRAWGTRDRGAVSPVRVPPVPMMVWASPHDTVVDAARNAAVCVAEDRAAGGSVTYTRTTGDHGDRSNFHPAEVLAFFEAHRTPRSGTGTAVEKSSTIRRP